MGDECGGAPVETKLKQLRILEVMSLKRARVYKDLMAIFSWTLAFSIIILLRARLWNKGPIIWSRFFPICCVGGIAMWFIGRVRNRYRR